MIFRNDNKTLNLTIIIGAIIAVIILDALPMGYAEYLSWSRYYPGRYDWITQILASNQFVALGVFIVVVSGLLSSLGDTIYKIFFKYK